MNTNITYQDHLPETHFDEAAELYESAFGPKFARAIPQRSDRMHLIRNGFHADFAFTAFDGDRLVGLAGYQTSSGYLTGGITPRAIWRKLGPLPSIRAIIILSLYDRTPAKGELVMDGIAVRSSHRGRGIGTELLRHTVAFAAERGYARVRLDVIDTNPAARKLYERFGFKIIKEERYPYLRGILGFSGSATMEYGIDRPAHS